MPHESSKLKHHDLKDSLMFGIGHVKPDLDESQMKFLKSKKKLGRENGF
jgi:hypothetical protein